jgi:hypothetical protein
MRYDPAHPFVNRFTKEPVVAVNAIDTHEIVRRHRNDDGTYRLAELSLAIGAERELWQPVVDAADGVNRHWRAVHECDEVDIYAISWLPGQTTGFHDHCDSSFGVTCVRGAIFEDRPWNGPNGVETNRVEVGATTDGVPGVMHVIRYADGDPGVTIHCYAPKLLRVGQIFYDKDGRWVRRERDGQEELVEGLLPC